MNQLTLLKTIGVTQMEKELIKKYKSVDKRTRSLEDQSRFEKDDMREALHGLVDEMDKENVRELLHDSIVLGIGITTLFLFTMGTMLPTSRVFAADINCANIITICLGTTGDDGMAGDNTRDFIDGNQGNDQIAGSGERDLLCGGAGDDKISGGDDHDTIIGDRSTSPNSCTSTGGSTGADIISGGAGKDIIIHGDDDGNGNLGGNSKSDGHRDIIDCGAGADIAVINISVDHDVATNCESVFAG